MLGGLGLQAEENVERKREKIRDTGLGGGFARRGGGGGTEGRDGRFRRGRKR